ncbi:MAG: IPT/TIG domain-containing protein [Pedococcus sp.]
MSTQPPTGNIGSSAVTEPRRPRARVRSRRRKVVGATSVAAVLAVAGVGTLATTAQAALVTGTLVAQNLTRPGGGAFLPGGGGHFWVSDGVLGLCETLPASATTTKCNGTAKGGQVVYDSTKSLVYQADGSTKTNQVLRFLYTATSDGLSAGTTLQVPNQTAVGGGSGGGRAQGIALGTGPDGNERLFVGYLKSGDIMQVLNPSGKDRNGATVTPTVSKVGSTSDGRGINALSFFSSTDAGGAAHHDLYIAESGGAGMSVIKDIDGTGGRPACGASQCTATTVASASGAALFSFPGGLANDGKVLYIGDAPRNTPSQVLTYNPLTGAKDVLSTDISPAYTSSFDGVRRTQYQNITGVAVDPATLDVYVGDDPSFPLATPVNAQGHEWKVAGTASQPVITAVSPSSGDVAGGQAVTITGKNLVNAVAGSADQTAFGTTVKFGTLSGTGVTCTADGTSCTATAPASSGAGVVDVRVTNAEAQTSAKVAADQFTYTAAAPAPGSPVVTSISPGTGLAKGGTTVTVKGSALVNPDGTASVSFGASPATGVSCLTDGSQCTAVSPPGTNGSVVDVQVTTNVGTSTAVAADRFTYLAPIGTLYSSGITAPKGGVTWIPDTSTSAGGHYWVSDHGNGLCRLDPVPGTTVNAPNVAACDPGFTIGSPGQAVYDPRTNADGTHWVYVPDNAVRSPGVWRLAFHPGTATIDSPVGMAPGLMENLKTNALALDQAHDALYVGDLVDGNIRRIKGIQGDPRSQTVDVVATTQAQKVGGGAAGRGINGTMALLGNRIFLPENNAATYFDTTSACANPTVDPNPAPCQTTTIDFLATPAPVFIAGVAADAKHDVVYISESPGTANATVYRFDASTITAATPGGSAGIVYVTSGKVPAAGTPEATVYCSLTCTRPADPALTPGGTTGFPFAQGVYVDPNSSDLYVTEDVTAGARSGRGHAWVVPYIP